MYPRSQQSGDPAFTIGRVTDCRVVHLVAVILLATCYGEQVESTNAIAREKFHGGLAAAASCPDPS